MGWPADAGWANGPQNGAPVAYNTVQVYGNPAAVHQTPFPGAFSGQVPPFVPQHMFFPPPPGLNPFANPFTQGAGPSGVAPSVAGPSTRVNDPPTPGAASPVIVTTREGPPTPGPSEHEKSVPDITAESPAAKKGDIKGKGNAYSA